MNFWERGQQKGAVKATLMIVQKPPYIKHQIKVAMCNYCHHAGGRGATLIHQAQHRIYQQCSTKKG